MDVPKVTRLVGGRVRTQTQAAMRHLVPDTAHRRWRGTGVLKHSGQPSSLLSPFPALLPGQVCQPGTPAPLLAARSLDRQL